MNNRLYTAKLLLVCVLVTGLVACGESDLVDIHDRELEDAIAALEEPDTAPANPSTDPDSQNEGDQEPVTGSEPETGNPLALNLDDYELVFSDEFSGETLDQAKWNTVLPWGTDFFI